MTIVEFLHEARRASGALLLLRCYSPRLVLAGCQHDEPLPFRLTRITGHMPDLAFQLTNDEGKPPRAADYRGKVVLLYFGYTHCPDVCPLTLAHLHVVMQRLGPLADDARILFVIGGSGARHARGDACIRPRVRQARGRA